MKKYYVQFGQFKSTMSAENEEDALEIFAKNFYKQNKKIDFSPVFVLISEKGFYSDLIDFDKDVPDEDCKMIPLYEVMRSWMKKETIASAPKEVIPLLDAF